MEKPKNVEEMSIRVARLLELIESTENILKLHQNQEKPSFLAVNQYTDLLAEHRAELEGLLKFYGFTITKMELKKSVNIDEYSTKISGLLELIESNTRNIKLVKTGEYSPIYIKKYEELLEEHTKELYDLAESIGFSLQLTPIDLHLPGNSYAMGA